MQPPKGKKAVSQKLLKSDFYVFGAGYAEQVAGGFRPRKDTRPVRLSLPLDWNMDPLKDRNWCFQLHAWRMLQPVWSEFYGRDWARLKAEVLPWVRDWYAYHVRRRKKSAFMWYDMAAGLRAQHLALLLHLQDEGRIVLDEEEQGEVDELARLHIAKLRDPSFISGGNHGIFQLVGLRLLGIVRRGRPEVEGEEAYSSELMGRLLDSQFGHHGVHVENSPAYHNFAVTHFGRIRPELFPSISKLFKEKLGKARDIAPWFTLPDGTIAAIGDSEGLGQKFSPDIRHDAESRSKWGDRVLMRDLTPGGYAAIRTGLDTPPYRAEMLIIKGQAFTTSHAHADHLGFELYAHGQPMFVDSGKFTYNRDSWRNYFVSDRAHNVVGLLGRSFGPYDTAPGQGGLVRAERLRDEYVVEGHVSRGDEFIHHRKFLYRPGERLTLWEEIEAPAGAAPVAYFHLAEHADALVTDAGVDVVVRGRAVATLTFTASDLVPRLARGQKGASVQGWRSPSYGKRQQATTIELVGRSDLRCWQVDIHLHEPRQPSDLLQTPLPLSIQVPLLYSCRTDRVMPGSELGTERRIVLEYYNGNPRGVDTLMHQELSRGGFARISSRPEQEGVRAYYRHENGIKANVLIRPAETFAVRSQGAVGTIYMAFTTPHVRHPGASAPGRAGV
ncbi:alginate lyase family protein [Luteimonas sp. SJ-92]|uniref:Alginate lyase family protein n=1 Tax=Luteimonas salinisoli TaxID=2752307 RepID=A0A853J870_9GAMM|nr:heparinase II/III-family protein [Luteimonas salinisoli]NZA25321.1 alginate lyase family protein [Luteimonas salinisoli]